MPCRWVGFLEGIVDLEGERFETLEIDDWSAFLQMKILVLDEVRGNAQGDTNEKDLGIVNWTSSCVTDMVMNGMCFQ